MGRKKKEETVLMEDVVMTDVEGVVDQVEEEVIVPRTIIAIKREQKYNPANILEAVLISLCYDNFQVNFEEEEIECTYSIGFKKSNNGKREDGVPVSGMTSFYNKIAKDILFLTDAGKNSFERFFLQKIDYALAYKGHSDIVNFINSSNPAWDYPDEDNIEDVFITCRSMFYAEIRRIQADERAKQLVLSNVREDDEICVLDQFIPSAKNILRLTNVKFVIYPFKDTFTLETINDGQNPRVQIPEIYVTTRIQNLKPIVPGLTSVFYNRTEEGYKNIKLSFKEVRFAELCANHLLEFYSEE